MHPGAGEEGVLGTWELSAAGGRAVAKPTSGLQPLKLEASDLCSHLDFREARKICNASVKSPFLHLCPSSLSS